MLKERFFQLLSRKMANEATVQEMEELDRLIQQNEEWERLIDELNTTESQNAPTDDTDAALTAHLVKMELTGRLDEPEKLGISAYTIPQTQSIRRKKWMWAAAAIFLLAGVTSLWQLMNTAKTTASTNEVVTQKGSKTSIKLPDGTRVWLNSDSKLTYAEDFSGSKREINLTGEAYFDVAHDADRPFIIHTQKMDIRVLGTAFNVKSYPQDDIVETVLIRGKIEVTFPGRLAEKIILKPNEKLILRKEPEKQNSSANEIKTNTQIPKMMVNTLEYISKDSVVAETAWLDNKLAFTNETLGNIAVELERKFDIRIDFKTEALKAYRYTGLFDQQNPEKILQLLSLSKAFKLRVEDKRIILSQ